MGFKKEHKWDKDLEKDGNLFQETDSYMAVQT